MAGAGYQLFVPGQILTAAQVNTLFMQQTTMAFASAAAGDTALSSVKSEMMHRTLLDVNCDQVYTGTGTTWSTIGPMHGALSTVTPTVTQGGAVSKTVTSSTQSRIGRKISGICNLAITGAGTPSATIQITGLGTSVGGQVSIGSGFLTAAGIVYPFIAYFVSSSTIQFFAANTAGAASIVVMGSGGNTYVGGLASGDSISFNYQYEAAADA